MYIRRSAEEIRNIKKEQWRKAFNPKWPVTFGFLAALVVTPMVLIFGTKFNPPGSLADDWLFISFKSFVICFIVIQVYQIFGRNYMGSNLLDESSGFDYRVCAECKLACHDSKKSRCDCKGKLEPRLYYEEKT